MEVMRQTLCSEPSASFFHCFAIGDAVDLNLCGGRRSFHEIGSSGKTGWATIGVYEKFK
jgi:hypothetical protein